MVRERMDITGQVFGEWTVLHRMPDYVEPGTGRSRPVWLCRCTCGTESPVKQTKLRTSGVSVSCSTCATARGHILRARPGAYAGQTRHPLYKRWTAMMRRCYNPKDLAYPNYGGRGITVCDDWHVFANYAAWVEEHLGPQPEGLTPSGQPLYSIDRIDNESGYEPDNIRWADTATQLANQRPMRVGI